MNKNNATVFARISCCQSSQSNVQSIITATTTCGL